MKKQFLPTKTDADIIINLIKNENTKHIVKQLKTSQEKKLLISKLIARNK